MQVHFKKQRVQFGSFGNRCFYAINIDSLVSAEHRSIEWVYLDNSQSDEEFFTYWKDFISDYLAKNFGTGGYRLVRMVEYSTPEGRPGVRYIGTGTNNGGGEGSIYGVAMQFDERMANVYSITKSPIQDGEDELDSEEAVAIRVMAESLTCSSWACKKP